VRRMLPEFHARFSALSRRYHYVIYDDPVAPALMVRQLTHSREPLNVEAMHDAGQYLLGECDFTSFRAAGCQSRTPFRDIMRLQVTRHRRYIVLDVEANAFLQHMVRNIAGTLMRVGSGKRPPEWVREVLEARDRKMAAMTASPYGLYLAAVTYPASWDLPVMPAGPVFLQPLT
jgi:tRNA pseudouridine38-40 synthase